MWLKSRLKNVGCNIRQPVLGYVMVLWNQISAAAFWILWEFAWQWDLVVFLYGNASNFLFSLKKPQQKKLPSLLVSWPCLCLFIPFGALLCTYRLMPQLLHVIIYIILLSITVCVSSAISWISWRHTSCYTLDFLSSFLFSAPCSLVLVFKPGFCSNDWLEAPAQLQTPPVSQF